MVLNIMGGPLKKLFITAIIFLGISSATHGNSGQPNAGQELYEAGLYTDAGVIFSNAINEFKNNTGSLPDYISAIKGQANVFSKTGKYIQADSLFFVALDMQEKAYGKNTLEYAGILNDLVIHRITYYNLKDNEEWIKQALHIYENVIGKNNKYYVEALNTLANNYVFANNVTEIKQTLDECFEIYSHLADDTTSLLYAKILLTTGHYFFYKEQFEESKTYYNKSAKIVQNIYNTTHPDYIVASLSLTSVNASMGKYNETRDTLLKIIPVLTKNHTKNHPYYAAALSNLGTLYYITGNYPEAIKILNKSLESSRKALIHEDSYYLNSVNTINSLAMSYEHTGLHEKAEPLLLESLEWRKKLYGNNSTITNNALNNLAMYYVSMKNYNEAEKYLLEAVNNLEEGDINSIYVYPNILNNLGVIYYGKGYPDKALHYHEKAADITRTYLGETHPIYIACMNQIASLTNDPGFEKHFAKMLKNQENITGKNSMSYVVCLSGIGNYYLRNDKYSKARDYYREALEFIKLTDGDNDDSHIKILNHLGIIETCRKNYKGACRYYNESLVLMKNLIREKFDSLSEAERGNLWNSINSNLNLIHSVSNDVPQNKTVKELTYDTELFAKGLLLNSFQHTQQSILNSEDEHDIYVWQQLNKKKTTYTDLYDKGLQTEKYIYEKLLYEYRQQALAMLLNCNDKDIINAVTEAEAVMAQGNEEFALYEKEIIEIETEYDQSMIKWAEDFSFHSVDEFRQALKEDERFAEMAKMLQVKEIIDNEKKKLEDAKKQYVMLQKDLDQEYVGFLQDAVPFPSAGLKKTIFATGDSTFIQKWDELTELKNECGKLNREIQAQEKELIHKSDKSETDDVKWQNVQQVLEPDEAAIEFVNFYVINKKEKRLDHRQYNALIIRQGYKYPVNITLGTEKELIQLLIEQDSTIEIYDAVWQPLQKYLDGIKKVYIAPAGLLHGISFAGLKKDDQYLCDEYIIHNLLSTKDIIALKNKKDSENKEKTAVMFGGADFGIPLNEMSLLDHDLPNEGTYNLTRSMLDNMNAVRGQGFDYLPGTRKEVMEINNLLSSLQWKTHLHIDMEATETRFKSYSSANSPEVMHISTHGFYFPLSKSTSELLFEETNKYKLSDDPLMRSGLAFTGANHAWNGKKLPNNINDGILTAYEVSRMNLNNTELVVLSACETGLGDIIGNEGVYGLQRAFRQAGAQSMLVSLWKVNDKETVELMKEFYTQWTNGLSIREAFSKAQNKLRESYPDKPEIWAAFVLIE